MNNKWKELYDHQRRRCNLMFEKLPPAKLLLKCAVPAALSMIFSGLHSIADGIFVGRCIGSDALAAVNHVMPLIAIAFSLAELIATGSSVQPTISYCKGAGLHKRVSGIWKNGHFLLPDWLFCFMHWQRN